MAAPVTLRCTACGYENESQRVYCHNCGTKLDRRLLPRELLQGPDNAKVEQHIKKMIDPRRGIVRARTIATLKSLGVAFGLALVLTIFRVPDAYPERLSNDDAAAAPFIYDDLQAAMNQGSSRRFAYTQAQVNAYLQTAYRSRDTVVPLLKFDRVVVLFEEGSVEVAAQFEIASLLPVSLSSRQRVVLRDGRIDNQVIGGRIGRLSIPGPVMKLAELAWGPLWKLLERDRKNVAKLQSINFRQTIVPAEGTNPERREAAVEMITKAGSI
ncbi:MAG: zinc ribbon domain-containing protein [Verrucomicrobia bacterium]|nr:zinc ribbon domain-containing protein [Verrucomicrobiota bacterium]